MKAKYLENNLDLCPFCQQTEEDIHLFQKQ